MKITTRSDREIVMTRVFNAPRHLVFEALTQPELVQRWLVGPPGWSMVTCQIDLNVGGTFRFVWRNHDGSEIGMHGLYQEISPPDRLVNTETFDFGCEAQSGEQLATTILTERERKTTLTCSIIYPSKEARDAIFGTDMERGVTASYNRLEELLASTLSQVGT
jgi:uncharacterized protein YndB with AHSA1/START domain